MEKIVLVIVTALIAFMGWTFISEQNHKKVFKQWSIACNTQGGAIRETFPSWWECVVDGKIKVLSGYEQYQADKPTGAPSQL